jgi:hypothetical protein
VAGPYDLLNEYFDGLPVETLRPLLTHKDTLVRHAAVWVTSELGQQACTLLDDVIPLITSDDRYLSYHALEITVVCAVGNRADGMVHFSKALESGDDVVRALAMRLLARADQTQLEAAAQRASADASANDAHTRGLSLLAASEACDPGDVQRMLHEDNSVARMFAVIAAKRLQKSNPELLEIASGLSNSTMSRFAREAD